MDKRDVKFAVGVTIADFLISVPYLVALYVPIFNSTELSDDVVKLWGKYWVFVHYPIEEYIAVSFFGNVSEGGQVTLWTSSIYFISCFAQTFFVALLIAIIFRKIHKQFGSGTNGWRR